MKADLLPALIGAILGLPLIVFGAWRLAKRWSALRPHMQWTLFVLLGLVEIFYWANVYAWFVEPNMLVVRRYSVSSAHWSGPPLTIAALSDTHVTSPHVSARRVERVVARINGLHPDLVVLLGDYAGGHHALAHRDEREIREIANGIAVFAALDARLGVVAVIGNHDVWLDRWIVEQGLQEAGVAVLWDQNVTIANAAGDFVVVGLEDEVTSHPDYASAADGAEHGLDRIVLTHSPDVFPTIPDDVALTIAGHTHCGQVSLPLIGRPIVPSHFGQRYACGLIVESGKQMVVTGGLGTSIAPLRFFNPPEVALITLQRAEGP